MSARAERLAAATPAVAPATSGAAVRLAAATSPVAPATSGRADRHLAVLDRAAGWFLAPAADAPLPAIAPAERDRAARAVVLGAPRDAPAVAAALAGALRAVAGASAAVTAVWSPAQAARGEAPPGVPDAGGPARLALPAARRLAARLALRGLAASARGRVAWVGLPSAEDRAVPHAARLRAAVDVPVAIAVAGPRSAGADALLADCDLVVVVTAEPDGPLARLALAGLAGLGTTTLATGPLTGPPRQAALAGFGGLRCLAEPLRAAVRTCA